jgi:hypothetical protein
MMIGGYKSKGNANLRELNDIIMNTKRLKLSATKKAPARGASRAPFWGNWCTDVGL